MVILVLANCTICFYIVWFYILIIGLNENQVKFKTIYVYVFLACIVKCKCIKGSSNNGGVNVSSKGYCEAHCSKQFGGVRYCGTGKEYEEGYSIDCTSCKGKYFKHTHTHARTHCIFC